MSAALPSERSKEKSFAWANRQKHAALSAAQIAAMDSVDPDWRRTYNGAWFTKLESVEAFFRAKGRFPRASAKDTAEKPLGVWLATQRYKTNELSSDRRKQLDERLPGWNASIRDDAWEKRLREVCAIVAELGRVPGTTEKDSAAKRAGDWLHYHRKFEAADPRVIALNAAIPGWNASTYDNKWRHGLDALKAFVATHGRFPTVHEKDRDSKRIGVWLQGQRSDDKLSPERRDTLDREVPGWNQTAAVKWTRSMDFAVAYFAEHGQFPSTRSSDPAVAACGRWLVLQRSKTLPPHRKAALDERLPGWQNGKDEKWSLMLDYVEAFVKEHGRFPSSGATVPEQERAAAIWIRHQRRGTGMTPERTALLDERLPNWRDKAPRWAPPVEQFSQAA